MVGNRPPQQMLDPETGALERSVFSFMVNHHLQLIQRSQRTLVLLLVTVDRAHPLSSAALPILARYCLDTIRATDLMGRLDAHQLALAFPTTGETTAEQIIWRLETQLKKGRAAGTFPHELGVDWRVRVGTADGPATFDALIAPPS
ncbi:MAG: GGDEF domain-containing protein [Nitrospirota bacterium]|nr:GGDEF domain-containing protein [Nitrospirota bacterium]